SEKSLSRLMDCRVTPLRGGPAMTNSSLRRLLAALQDRTELLVRLFQLRGRIGAGERCLDGRADEIAEFGNRDDYRQPELRNLRRADHRLQPLLRQRHTLAHLVVVEARIV